MEEMISMTRNRQRYDPQSFMGPHYPNYYSNPMPSVPTSNTNIFEDYEARGLSICTQIDPNSRSSAHLSAILELFFDFWKNPPKAERYRNRVLERQLQDINRAHAREKQGLVTKLEDLR